MGSGRAHESVAALPSAVPSTTSRRRSHSLWLLSLALIGASDAEDVVDEPHGAQALGEIGNRRGLTAHAGDCAARLREESRLAYPVVLGGVDVVALALVRVLELRLLERLHGPAPARRGDGRRPWAGPLPQPFVERRVAAREFHVREHDGGVGAAPRRDALHLRHLAAREEGDEV